MSCDAPGLNKDDIDVAFEDNVLKITAERKEEKKEEVCSGNWGFGFWGSCALVYVVCIWTCIRPPL